MGSDTLPMLQRVLASDYARRMTRGQWETVEVLMNRSMQWHRKDLEVDFPNEPTTLSGLVALLTAAAHKDIDLFDSVGAWGECPMLDANGGIIDMDALGRVPVALTQEDLSRLADVPGMMFLSDSGAFALIRAIMDRPDLPESLERRLLSAGEQDAGFDPAIHFNVFPDMLWLSLLGRFAGWSQWESSQGKVWEMSSSFGQVFQSRVGRNLLMNPRVSPTIAKRVVAYRDDSSPQVWSFEAVLNAVLNPALSSEHVAALLDWLDARRDRVIAVGEQPGVTFLEATVTASRWFPPTAAALGRVSSPDWEHAALISDAFRSAVLVTLASR